MSASNTSRSLGPLPKTDRNAKLEELSFRAFQNVLPVDKFVFRDERSKDKGVDGSIELLIDSGHTNLRAQVQLKGTDSDKVNADGSVPVKVDVSNLNYLLNGLSPLYVLYVVPRDELRFLWAREEVNRLNQMNPGWERQDTVTLHFKHLLTKDSLADIHEQIRKEAQLQRRVHDILGRASSSERVVTSIDPATLENTDPDQAFELLMTSGTTIVASGYASYVRELAAVLNPDKARAPRIQLIRGYAEFTLGRYQIALGSLAEASLNIDELSPKDRQFLTIIRDACDYHTGRISLGEYSDRIEARATQGAGVAAFDHINRIRYALFKGPDLKHRTTLLEEMRSAVGQMLRREDVGDSYKLMARLVLLESEGHQSLLHALNDMSKAFLGGLFGHAAGVQTLLQSQSKRYQLWERGMNVALQEAIATNNPLLTADALLTRTTIKTTFLTTFRLITEIFGAPIAVSRALISEAMSDAERAVQLHSQAGQLEGEIRAKLMKADLLALTDQEPAAIELAKEVLPKAQAMNYVSHIEHAKDLIAEQSLFKRCMTSLDARRRRS